MMIPFTDQSQRLKRILANALTDAVYEASHTEEEGRMLVIEARRSDGRRVGLRFRGVRDSEATASPAPGASLRLNSVSAERRFSLSMIFLPFPRARGVAAASRVRIDAGGTRLDIVCQDAEWWEEPGPAATS